MECSATVTKFHECLLGLQPDPNEPRGRGKNSIHDRSSELLLQSTARAKYQRLIDRIFEEIIGKAMKVYEDDIVVKSASEDAHLVNLEKVFHLLKRHDLRLNLDKCSFGVQAGEFLSFVLTHRGMKPVLPKTGPSLK